MIYLLELSKKTEWTLSERERERWSFGLLKYMWAAICIHINNEKKFHFAVNNHITKKWLQVKLIIEHWHWITWMNKT